MEDAFSNRLLPPHPPVIIVPPLVADQRDAVANRRAPQITPVTAVSIVLSSRRRDVEHCGIADDVLPRPLQQLCDGRGGRLGPKHRGRKTATAARRMWTPTPRWTPAMATEPRGGSVRGRQERGGEGAALLAHQVRYGGLTATRTRRVTVLESVLTSAMAVVPARERRRTKSILGREGENGAETRHPRGGRGRSVTTLPAIPL